MKKTFFILFIFCFLVTFISCSNKPKRSRKPVSTIVLIPNQKEYRINNPISVQIKTNLKNGNIEKIELFYENELITTEKSLDFTIELKTIAHLGPNSLKVIATKTDGVNNTRYKTFSVLSDINPKINDFEVIKEYNHSVDFFTEGLLMHNGFLYESTGQNGASAIHKINLNSGSILLKKDLDKKYFGEGITILNDKIYQLTYTSKKGFVYNLSDFALIDSFQINSAQGWGLTNDGEYLIMSDGTNKLTWIDPETYIPKKDLYVASNKMHQNNVNELEYIDGSIFANIWMKNYIIEIDAESGKILSTTDLSDLYGMFSSDFPIDVLNGIALNESTGNLLVTGKWWPVMFEIKLKESE
ncbi:MAG: glutaminyl-peptide cyclotransferase [Mariniphaga sp.]|nr:glutaminyl-peptide cyclotransferase [Mariniphaga sp.]